MLERLKKIFSSDPMASYARTASGLAVLVFLALDVYAVIKTRALSGGPVLPCRDTLIGQAVFISSVYGCGKLGETVQKFADGNRQ
jgi:hypothetical protein